MSQGMMQECRVCGFRGSVDAMERHGSIAHRELILGSRGNTSGESVANVRSFGKYHGGMMQSIEEARAFWAGIAKDNGWYREPFYVQVWLDVDGFVEDSVSSTALTQDVIIGGES